MANPVTTQELMSALDKLILAEKTKNELCEDDITLFRLIKKAKWNHYRAKKALAEWQADGKIEYIGKRRNPVNGRMMDAWRVIEKG